MHITFFKEWEYVNCCERLQAVPARPSAKNNLKMS